MKIYVDIKPWTHLAYFAIVIWQSFKCHNFGVKTSFKFEWQLVYIEALEPWFVYTSCKYVLSIFRYSDRSTNTRHIKILNKFYPPSDICNLRQADMELGFSVYIRSGIFLMYFDSSKFSTNLAWCYGYNLSIFIKLTNIFFHQISLLPFGQPLWITKKNRDIN